MTTLSDDPPEEEKEEKDTAFVKSLFRYKYIFLQNDIFVNAWL